MDLLSGDRQQFRRNDGHADDQSDESKAMTRSLSTRFHEQFIPEPNSGCWIWIGSVCGRGYGMIKQEGHIRRSSRLSWELFRGKIPSGLCVCHTCDVPLCVNPDHLFVGTNADNTQDMIRKSRYKNGRAIVTRDQAVEIRNSSLDNEILAAKYGLSRIQVYKIRSGNAWK